MATRAATPTLNTANGLYSSGGIYLLAPNGDYDWADSGVVSNSKGVLTNYSSKSAAWSDDATLGRKAVTLTAASSHYITDASAATAMSGVSAATLSVWVYLATTNSQTYTGFGLTVGYRFGIQTYNGVAYWVQENNGTSTATYGQCSISLTGWHHFAMPYNGGLTGNARISAYIDGVAKTLTYSASPPAATMATGANLAARILGYVNSGYYGGSFADLIMLPSTLTQTQVRQLAGRDATTNNALDLYDPTLGGLISSGRPHIKRTMNNSSLALQGL